MSGFRLMFDEAAIIFSMATKHTMSAIITVGTYSGGLQGWIFDGTNDLKVKYSFGAHDGAVKAMHVGSHKSVPLLASGGSDEFIKVYNVNTGEEVTSLMKHGAAVSAISFADSKHMLSGSDKGDIIIWRTEDWQALHTLGGHKGPINSIAIHPSSKVALSVSRDKTLRMWNLIEGRMSFILKLPQEAEQVVWSPSGSKYAVLYDRLISIHSLEGGKELARLSHTSKIACFCFISDDIVASTGEAKVINIWNSEGKLLHVATTSSDIRVRCVTTLPRDGESFPWLVSASTNGLVQLWDPTEWVRSGNEGERSEGIDAALVTSASISDGHRVTSLTAQCLTVAEEAETEKPVSKKRTFGEVGDSNSGSAKKQKKDASSKGGDKKTTVAAVAADPKSKAKAKAKATIVLESEEKKPAAPTPSIRTKLQKALNFARYAKKGGGGGGRGGGGGGRGRGRPRPAK